MVNFLHAPLIPSFGNLPTSIGTSNAHSMDDAPQISSQLQKPILLAIRTCTDEDVLAIPYQFGYLAEWFDCIEVSEHSQYRQSRKNFTHPALFMQMV